MSYYVQLETTDSDRYPADDIPTVVVVSDAAAVALLSAYPGVRGYVAFASRKAPNFDPVVRKRDGEGVYNSAALGSCVVERGAINTMKHECSLIGGTMSFIYLED